MIPLPTPLPALSRRDLMQGVGATAALSLLPRLSRANTQTQEPQMQPKAFVYTEVQISIPFNDAPWQQINESLLVQPGFLNKTWLSGLGTGSLGGFYAFDSLENAQAFVTGYFPGEARNFGVAHNTRVFDAEAVAEASAPLNSPYFGGTSTARPGAFVYTELQVNVPFAEAPWRERNPALLQTPGLLAKTWLSGVNTNTLGGFDAFDTVESAKAFAIDAFPKVAAAMNCAFYTRVFDASVTEEASRQLHSPYFA